VCTARGHLPEQPPPPDFLSALRPEGHRTDATSPAYTPARPYSRPMRQQMRRRRCCLPRQSSWRALRWHARAAPALSPHPRSTPVHARRTPQQRCTSFVRPCPTAQSPQRRAERRYCCQTVCVCVCPSAPKPPYSPVSKSGQLSTCAPSLQPAAGSHSGIV
jgi:hypothetical protein